jgi:hypothetical protein
MEDELPSLKNKIDLQRWLKDLVDCYCDVAAGKDGNRLFESFVAMF